MESTREGAQKIRIAISQCDSIRPREGRTFLLEVSVLESIEELDTEHECSEQQTEPDASIGKYSETRSP